MRTLWLSLVGAVILVLSTGVGGAVVAQDEATTPEVPVVVTGTFTSEDLQSMGTSVEEAGISWWKLPWWKLTWEASDPRLIGQGTKISNHIQSESTQIYIGAETYVLDGPDGRWVGSSYFYNTSGDDAWSGVDLVVLRGEGGYDGLTAALSIDWGFPATFEGVIFPSEAPTVPDPVEPPAE